VAKDTADRLDRHKLGVGDILFGRRGEIGRHGLVGNNERGWLCGTGCFLVRIRDARVDNAFASRLFSTEGVVSWLASNAAGSIMPSLNNVVLAKLPVAFPALDEQREIVRILDATDRKINLHKRKRVVLEALFRALLYKLMTGELRASDLDLSALQAPTAERSA
jgi:type I restriction enzyme S subunit